MLDNDPIKKFERMIENDSSIFLDIDELEEIILHYFNEADIKMAEKAIYLGNNLYPNSININILHSEILILKGEINQSYKLIETLLNFNQKNLLLSNIHIRRSRRNTMCRNRWSPYQ